MRASLGLDIKYKEGDIYIYIYMVHEVLIGRYDMMMSYEYVYSYLEYDTIHPACVVVYPYYYTVIDSVCFYGSMPGRRAQQQQVKSARHLFDNKRVCMYIC